jgi:hypothetical protein
MSALMQRRAQRLLEVQRLFFEAYDRSVGERVSAAAAASPGGELRGAASYLMGWIRFT